MVLFCLAGWFAFLNRFTIFQEWRLVFIAQLLVLLTLGVGLLRSGHKQHLRISKMRKTSSVSKVSSWFGKAWASAILGGSMAAFIIYTVQSSRPNHSLLYGGLDLIESGRISTELDGMKMWYTVSRENAGNASIYVPRDTVHGLRMQLASKGMPQRKAGGVAIFGKPAFGMSDFVQRANYIRAIQEELALSIVQIEGIESARVVIVAPESRGLMGPEKKPTANVFLKTRGNAQLESRAIDAIRFLVANPIEGLEPSNVVVLDDATNIVSATNTNIVSATNIVSDSKTGFETPIPHLPAYPIDLSSFYNDSLSSSNHVYLSAGAYLGALRPGVHKWSGVEFDVQGIIQLNGRELKKTGAPFPERINGIRIGRRCHRIYFSHATGAFEKDGTKIGSYTVRFTDGHTKEIPLIYGENLANFFWGRAQLPRASLAWTTQYNKDASVKLYLSIWDNPLPDVEIQGIDFLSEMTACSPFLVAITVE